jgi:hypothetical protein
VTRGATVYVWAEDDYLRAFPFDRKPRSPGWSGQRVWIMNNPDVSKLSRVPPTLMMHVFKPMWPRDNPRVPKLPPEEVRGVRFRGPRPKPPAKPRRKPTQRRSYDAFCAEVVERLPALPRAAGRRAHGGLPPGPRDGLA